jgi:hypothetical protein
VRVSFLHAWHLWLQGQPTAPLLLWGHPILWWGRAGKVAEYLGALTAIVDIVGAQRLAAFGESLKHRSQEAEEQHLAAVVSRAGQTFQELREYFWYVMSNMSSRRNRTYNGIPLRRTKRVRGMGGQ